MGLESNIPEIIKKLEALKSATDTGANNKIPPDFSDAVFSAVNAGMGLMKQRIFNAGLDANNETLGVYVGARTKLVDTDKKNKKATKVDPEGAFTSYQKFRISRGRQIDYKDLELEGSLRRAIECVAGETVIQVLITNEELAAIAGYQEKQIGNIRAGQNANTGSAEPAVIFAFSEDEFEHVSAEGSAAIKQVIQKLFDAI